MITPTALLHFRFNAAGLFFCLQAGISAAEPRGILTPGVSNAIVLMTLLSKCPSEFSGQYHKYRRSPRELLKKCIVIKKVLVLFDKICYDFIILVLKLEL